MCLGIPMRVTSCDDLSARCEARGERREVTLILLLGEAVAPGDWVLVSAGNAARKLSEDEALATWALLDEMVEHEAQADA